MNGEVVLTEGKRSPGGKLSHRQTVMATSTVAVLPVQPPLLPLVTCVREFLDTGGRTCSIGFLRLAAHSLMFKSDFSTWFVKKTYFSLFVNLMFQGRQWCPLYHNRNV